MTREDLQALLFRQRRIAADLKRAHALDASDPDRSALLCQAKEDSFHADRACLLAVMEYLCEGNERV